MEYNLKDEPVGKALLEAENRLNNRMTNNPNNAYIGGLENTWNKVNEAIEAYKDYLENLPDITLNPTRG